MQPVAIVPANREAALALLADLGAPLRLRRHAELVGEAADALLLGLQRLRVSVHADFVRVGVALHDVGKAVHLAELDAPGHLHEPAGEQLLLQRGATPDVARVCRSHANWRDFAQITEEFLLALADKPWKGARVPELEDLIVARIAAETHRDRWELFSELDLLFEEVAGGADSRLARSVV